MSVHLTIHGLRSIKATATATKNGDCCWLTIILATSDGAEEINVFQDSYDYVRLARLAQAINTAGSEDASA